MDLVRKQTIEHAQDKQSLREESTHAAEQWGINWL
jgi:hypothetical protein